MNLCWRDHPRLLLFPFVVEMNRDVLIKRQFHRLHPHKRVPGEESEENGWQGPYRHETITGNMTGTGLPRNEGPGLHV